MKIKNLEELGSILKEERNKKGESVELISQKLFIKKNIIYMIEDGTTDKLSIEKTYLQGFINSYLKYLDLSFEFNINNLDYNKKITKKDSNIPLEIIPPKEKASGTMILLFSLLLLGLVYLLWQKQTYYDLKELGKIIDKQNNLRDISGKKY